MRNAISVCLALLVVGTAIEAHAECRGVRTYSEPGIIKDAPNFVMDLVNSVVGGLAYGADSGSHSGGSVYIGLDEYAIPDGATITSVTAYGVDAATPEAMTFSLRLASFTDQIPTVSTSWASTNGASSWSSGVLAVPYLSNALTYWVEIYVPRPNVSPEILLVHTVRVCWTV